jgi:Ig-like domain-containing protein
LCWVKGVHKGWKGRLYNAFWVFCGAGSLWAAFDTGAAPGAPVITNHPQSVTVAPGATAIFTVGATGEAPLRYLWGFNGSLVRGETNATLVISNVTQANAGSYLAVVFNGRGYDVSQSATLSIAQPTIPIITQHPQSQTVARGTNITLSVSYTGTGPFYFQWRRNGMNIPGGTNDTLALPNIQPADAGDYTVIVYTDAGAALSDVAAVRVALNDLPFRDQFDLQFTIPVSNGSGKSRNVGATIEPGEPAHAGKTSGRSVWIAWLPSVSGIATISLAGSSFDTLLAVYTGNVLSGLTEVASDDDSGGSLASRVTFNAIAGTQYKIAVAGLAGASGDFTFAWSLQATTEQAPQIVMPPLNQTVTPGGTATFVAEATPAGAALQWVFNGQAVAGANASTLVVPNASESNVGIYSLRVTHSARTAESAGASLQINATGSSSQDVVTSDKLADAVRIDRLLRLGRSGAGFARAKMSMASPPISRGYAGTHLFSTFGAISEPGEPLHCGVPGGSSYWFALAAEEAGEIRLDTEGSSFDTVLAVYTADGPSFADLQPVACDDNSGSDGRDSKLTFIAEASVIYLIAIDGVNGAYGTVRLNYALLAQANLAPLGRNLAGANQLRLSGQPGGTFEVQASLDWVTWTRLFVTNLITGTCEFSDSASTNTSRRYYRAITLSP